MDNNHHKKAVFFLGAGFSKAIIPSSPTLPELTERINSKYEAEKESVTLHFDKEILKQYKENIEHLLTFLSSNLPFKTEVQISADDALYKDLKNKIVDYFEKLEEDSKHDLVNNHITLSNVNRKNFSQYLCKNKVCCITLNYDLLLEQIVAIDQKIFFNDDKKLFDNFEKFYPIPMTSIKYRAGIGYVAPGKKPKDLPKILKLHGSINWLYAGISQSDPVFCNSDFAKENLAYLSKDLQPMIIPPVMDKTSIYNHTILKAIWRQAFEELKAAEEIYICGFSFPETDLSIRFLFQSALTDKGSITRIYIINLADDGKKIKEHYENIFKNIQNIELDFTYCCEDSLNKFIEEIIPLSED